MNKLEIAKRKIDLNKSKLEASDKRHKELVKSQADLSNAIENFADKLDKLDNSVDLKPLIESIKSLKIKTEFKAPDIKQPNIKIPPAQIKIVNINDDIYQTYKPANVESDENKQASFAGFVDPNGRWFIMRSVGDEEVVIKYVFGSSGYDRAWEKRIGLTYKRYDEAINA